MIILSPSTGLKKDTQLDYDLLSSILSLSIKLKKRVFFNLQKSKQDYSYYEEIDDEMYTIGIALNDTANIKDIIKIILHEIRHYIQEKQFRVKGNEFHSSYKDYSNSPEECDARKFEKLATEIIAIYNNFKKSEQKYKNLQLDKYAVHSQNN